jgi:glycosyltransferase involved in cell wall biosynthesis
MDNKDLRSGSGKHFSDFYRPTSFLQKIYKICSLYIRSMLVGPPVVEDLPPRRLILMIVPHVDRIGGYERQALELSRTLTEMEEFVVVLSHGGKHFLKREFRNGFVIRRLTSSGLYLLIQLFWFLFSRRKSYNVVHVHGITGFSLIGVRISLMMGLPVCIKPATRDDLNDMAAGDSFKKRVFRKWITRIPHWISISNELSAEIGKNGITSNAIHEIPNFVDTEKFRPPEKLHRQEVRSRFGIGDELVFLYLGRFEERKGIDVLLRAWIRTPCGLLWIVGTGPQENTLKDLAGTENISTVRFCGPTMFPLDYYQAADVFVLPSLKEGFPNVLLEAMSCGLPCISTSIGGVIDVMEQDRQGLLVSPGSVEMLSGALQKMKASPSERTRWGFNARGMAERYDRRLMARRYHDLYSRMLQ